MNGSVCCVFLDAPLQVVLADADDALQDGVPYQQERRQRLHPGVPRKRLQAAGIYN